MGRTEKRRPRGACHVLLGNKEKAGRQEEEEVYPVTCAQMVSMYSSSCRSSELKSSSFMISTFV